MNPIEAFEAWRKSADALWRRRMALQAAGIDYESDDAYVSAWVIHAERFSPPPPYPGVSDIVHAV